MARGDRMLPHAAAEAVASQTERLMSILFGTPKRLDGLIQGVRQDASAGEVALRDDIGWDNLKGLALGALSRGKVVSLADVAEELAKYLEAAGYTAIADETRERIKGAVN